MQGSSNRTGYFALDRKNIRRGQLPVIGIGPQVFIGYGIDQLHIDTHPVARSLHTAFEDRCDTQLLADGAHILGGVAVFHDRGPGNHF